MRKLAMGLLATLSMPVSAAQILQLHAPISTITPDGQTAYTYAFSSDGEATFIDSLNMKTFRVTTLAIPNYKGEIYPKSKLSRAAENIEISPEHLYKTEISPNGLYMNTMNSIRSMKDNFAILYSSQRKSTSGQPLHFSEEGNYLLISNGCVVVINRLLKPRDFLQFNIRNCLEEYNKEFLNNDSETEVLYFEKIKKLYIFNNVTLEIHKFDLNNPTKNPEDFDKTLIHSWYPAYDDKFGQYLGQFAAGSLSISPDKKSIAGGSLILEGTGIPAATAKRKTATGWVRDLETGKIKFLLWNQTWGIYTTAFSPDGRYLATLGDAKDWGCTKLDSDLPQSPYGDGRIALRRANTGTIIKKYPHACYGPIFSKDGKKMLYSDAKYRLHIIDLP